MSNRRVAFVVQTILWGALAGCAARPRPPELVTLEKLRDDPSLTDGDRRAFDLLGAADDLVVRAEGEWERRDAYGARRDALMGQIKMKTALALLEANRERARIAALDAEIQLAGDEDQRLQDQLATAREEVALLERLRTASRAAAEERKALVDKFEGAKKQAASERQRLAEALAAEKQRAEALDGLRRAELAIRAAETVDAPRYAKAKYTAAVNMLQDAHKQFDGGHWGEAIARTTLARSEAEGGTALARPAYEKAAVVLSAQARDRALEADATALPGIPTRLERDKDLQRLVLVLGGLFAEHQAVLQPTGGKVLDAVKDLIGKYPSYPLQLVAYTDDQGKPADLAALSLAQANAVYWAFVSRGIDPKRMTVEGKGGADPIADNATPAGRARNARVELSFLYHISD
jgi:outer membrane protein OmpA-like peptidoglycan-associated protein